MPGGLDGRFVVEGRCLGVFCERVVFGRSDGVVFLDPGKFGFCVGPFVGVGIGIFGIDVPVFLRRREDD